MPNEENSDYVPDKKEHDSRVESPSASPGHYNPPTDASEKRAYQQQNSSVKLAEDIRTGERWILGIGIATLVINTAIALIYWEQPRQMKEATRAAVASAEASKKALRTTNDTLAIANQSLWLDKRAWVGISPPATLNFFLIDPISHGYSLQYFLVIKNFGPGVALHVTSSFEASNVHTVAKATQETCEQAAQYSTAQAPVAIRGGYVLYPNDGTNAPGNELGSMEQLESPDGPLYIVGCILYQDQFGAHHRTRACFRTFDDINRGPPVRSPKFSMLAPRMLTESSNAGATI
jgi:hypothetical protein